MHQRALVIDSHNDSTVGHIRRGNIGLNGERSEKRRLHQGAIRSLREHIDPDTNPLQLDLQRMHQGGIDAAFFAIDVTRAWDNHLVYALDGLAYLKREIAEHSEDIQVALTTGDVVTARASEKRTAILAVENSDALHRSLNVLEALFDIGVRTMTLTHSPRSFAGDGCEVIGGSGLTGFGRDLVTAMNECGMLIDISHLNDAGFWDVLECSTDPVIASHSCCHQICNHPRNLTDEQLVALGESRGVVGITFVPQFLRDENPTLKDLVNHIAHAVEIAGIEAVGLGSDFDGGGTLITSAADYPLITQGLVDRGFDETALLNILGGNHLRLLGRVID